MSESPDTQQLSLIDAEASEDGALMPPAETWLSRRRSLVAVGFALLGVATLLALAAPRPADQPARIPTGVEAWVTELAEKGKSAMGNPCSGLPYLRLEKVLHSNLGGKGPDDGEEGIVFEASAYHSGVPETKAEVHLHALTEYRPTWPEANGIHGKFGEVNLEAGSNVTLAIYAVDPETKKNITLSRGSLTFFDLDQGKNNHSVEYVRVGNFSHFYVANGTELDVIRHEDGTVTFRAGKEGDGADNPKDPLQLTPLHKRKAVTLNFRNLSSLTFVLGSTAGNTTRVFHMVVRPSLLCANTVLADGSVGALDDVAGNPIPLQDAKVPVSLAHVQQLTDDYDCTGDSQSEWLDEKKAWCCDKKDIGCELIGISDSDEILGEENETGEENSTSDATTQTPHHSGAAQSRAVASALAAALLSALAAWPSSM